MSNRTTKRLIRRAPLLLLVAAASCFWIGCKALFSSDPMPDVRVPARRLRRIEPMDFQAMSADQSKEEAAGQGEPERAPAQLQLALAECRAVALENNLDLGVALLSPTIAGETVREAEAVFEPYLFSNFSYSRTETPVSTTLDASKAKLIAADLGVYVPLRTGGSITFDVPFSRSETNNVFATLSPAYTTDFVVSISQPLLRDADLRTNTHAIRLAHYESQITEARTKLEVIGVLAAVDRVYWRLYAARKEAEVRKNEYGLAMAQLARVERMVKAGTVAEVEIVRAQAGVAERLEGIIIADNSVRDRERELKLLLNKPGLGMETATVLIPSTEPNPLHRRLDGERLLEAALSNRMEMLELELRIAQDASTIQYQRNQALPVLALGYTYNINGLGPTTHDALDMLLDRRFEDHSVGLQLVVPIGNRAARSALRRAVYTRVQRLSTRKRRELIIQQEVANALDRLEATWQRILASRQRALLAGRNLEAEQRQFELGLRTSTDVLDAQTRLADAQSAEILALTEYQIAQVDLAYATGTTLAASAVEWEPAVPPERD